MLKVLGIELTILQALLLLPRHLCPTVLFNDLDFYKQESKEQVMQDSKHPYSSPET